MTRLVGVLYCCEVCGREYFCKEESTSGYFIDDLKYGKMYYNKPPAGWTPEMCPECNDRITRAIREEQSKIRRERRD